MMNRSEKVGKLKAAIASTETNRCFARGADGFLPLTRHNRIKSKPQIVSMKALRGSFPARLLFRLVKIVFVSSFTAGLGEFPRSRGEIEHGPGHRAN